MVEIDYTAVSLSAASKIRFRYMLDGYDKDWVRAGSRRQAFYTNLPPLHYRFLLGASTDGGQESVIEWPFDVPPAFYQTRLFYMAVFIFSIGMVATIWWLRLRVLRKQFDLVLDERARVGREIHDTVLQSLAATALQLEGLGKKIEPADVRTQVRYVRRQVEQYIYEARQSILELRSPTLEKQPLSAALRESGEHLLGDDSNARLDVVVTGVPQRFSCDVELQLLRIAQEAIRNAARHAQANRIHVELVYGADGFRMLVSDDGRGFSIPDSRLGIQHWGLVGMRERTKRLSGSFTLTSSPGKGTEVEATIPLPQSTELRL